MNYTPIPRITYKEVMEKYGNDRPDIREDKTDKNLLAFCWVVDFPMFEKTPAGAWTFTHNPFSAVITEHEQWLLEGQNLDKITAAQYDIVLNGYEIGGGSVRNHLPRNLRKVFGIIGFTPEQIQNNLPKTKNTPVFTEVFFLVDHARGFMNCIFTGLLVLSNRLEELDQRYELHSKSY